MTAPATEQRKCACGTDMVPTNIGSYAQFCANCDRIQPAEYTGQEGVTGARITTVQDRRFTLEWERRKREFYPRNGRKAA